MTLRARCLRGRYRESTALSRTRASAWSRRTLATIKWGQVGNVSWRKATVRASLATIRARTAGEPPAAPPGARTGPGRGPARPGPWRWRRPPLPASGRCCTTPRTATPRGACCPPGPPRGPRGAARTPGGAPRADPGGACSPPRLRGGAGRLDGDEGGARDDVHLDPGFLVVDAARVDPRQGVRRGRDPPHVPERLALAPA